MIKTRHIVFILFVLLCGCKNPSAAEFTANRNKNMEVANEFVEAFYSFDNNKLRAVLSQATKSQPSILYYQKWAECGNYEIIKRHECIEKNDSLVVCPVTVKDDLIGTLNLDFNVTDTFHLVIISGTIRSVQTSSNDPDLYYEAKEWVSQNLPELILEPCEGIMEGGPTPCECVRAMIEGFSQFIDFRNAE